MFRYEKQYQNGDELQRRFLNFLQNLERLPKSQANELGTAKHGVTQFFDQTLNEFKQVKTKKACNKFVLLSEIHRTQTDSQKERDNQTRFERC